MLNGIAMPSYALTMIAFSVAIVMLLAVVGPSPDVARRAFEVLRLIFGRGRR